MKRQLPNLAHRATRVRLLAASHTDAFNPDATNGRTDQHGDRLLLAGRLWTTGSYDELERAICDLEPHRRRVFRRLYVNRPFHDHPAAATAELDDVARAMPANIFVPLDVTLLAGYLDGDAGIWQMPAFEQRRRWARKPKLVAA